MSNTDAALKDINQALRIKKTAELFVNRGVIYQVMSEIYFQMNCIKNINKHYLSSPLIM
jgi:hypothetical protein